MRRPIVRLLLVLLVLTIGRTANALDFDKEIAKNENVTVTLVDSLDRKSTDQAKPDGRGAKCDCEIKLISKKRMVARQ